MDINDYKKKLGEELATACLAEFTKPEILAMVYFTEKNPHLKEPASEAVSLALVAKGMDLREKERAQEKPLDERLYG